MRWLVLAAVAVPAWVLSVVWLAAICRSNRNSDETAAERSAIEAEFFTGTAGPDQPPGNAYPRLIAALERQFERSEP
ncbi:hypothetical protein [Kitasatospora sp. NPDC001175]|uniref:hypothetical protein n=1 Tax=Kitasatospora sp. NPDC001175 TaxID=3157103 RepID=UPI003CFDC414